MWVFYLYVCMWTSGLKLSMELRLALNSWFSCPSFTNAMRSQVYHHTRPESIFGDSMCIGYFSHCFDQTPDKSNLRKFIDFHSLVAFSSPQQGRYGAGVWVGWSHCVECQKAERQEYSHSAHYFLFIQCRIPVHGMVATQHFIKPYTLNTYHALHVNFTRVNSNWPMTGRDRKNSPFLFSDNSLKINIFWKKILGRTSNSIFTFKSIESYFLFFLSPVHVRKMAVQDVHTFTRAAVPSIPRLWVSFRLSATSFCFWRASLRRLLAAAA